MVDTEPGSTGISSGPLDYNVTGRRIVAALLDLIPLIVLFFVMAAAVGHSSTTVDEGGTTTHIVRLDSGQFGLYCLLALGYFVGFEALADRTPGKFLMGLKVVKLDGGYYGLVAILVRNLLRIIDGLPAFYILGLVVVAVTQKNQRLGDLATGTLVVRAS